MIFGINGVGAIVNFAIPFRVGDILRFLFFAKKLIGYKTALFFIVVERLSDLIIANSIFFSLGAIYPGLRFSIVNPLGLLIGTTGFLLLFLCGYNKAVKNHPNWIYDVVSSYYLVFGKKSIFRLFMALTVSWVLTTCALLLISSDSKELLQGWISVNSNYSDPFSFILSSNKLLITTLLIPLLLAFIYSFTIPSPKKLAHKVLKEFLKHGVEISSLLPFQSPYAGSGARLYIAETLDLATHRRDKYMVRIETKNHQETNPTEFMIEANPSFKFPKVYFSQDFRGERCTISEFIRDFDRGASSKNLFEVLINSEREGQLKMFTLLVSHIQSFHRLEVSFTDWEIDALIKQRLGFDLEYRVHRACAFIFLNLNQINSKEKNIHYRVKSIQSGLISRLRSLQSEIEIGSGHGDASLSNFLFQKSENESIIRSIDPNTRFQVRNIEYDLSKVMQSTHALYEFLLKEIDSFPSDRSSFLKFRSTIGWDRVMDEIILELHRKGEVNIMMLQTFLLLHLVRIAPYKVNGGSIVFERYVDLVVWVSEDAGL